MKHMRSCGKWNDPSLTIIKLHIHPKKVDAMYMVVLEENSQVWICFRKPNGWFKQVLHQIKLTEGTNC